MSIFMSIFSVYIFIIFGFIAKHIFKDEINEKTFMLIGIYFLQPLLVFWSLSIRPINGEFAKVPLAYFALMIVVWIVTLFFGKFIFQDPKERALLIASSILGNTSNIGIPIGIAIFGESSVPYTGAITLVNIFLMQTLGVYTYSRGEFSVKASIFNILKLPAFSVAFVAIVLNMNDIKIHDGLMNAMKMGSYAFMVMQLILFGIFLKKVRLVNMNKKLLLSVSMVKYIFVPILCFAVIYLFQLPPLFAGVLFLQMLMPTAINNISYSLLFNCRPIDSTMIVFVSSILFIPIVFIFIWFLHYIGNNALL